MTSLLYEIVFYLGGAAVIGFLTGWFARPARRAASSRREAKLRATTRESVDYQDRLADQFRRKEEASNESIGRIASEIEQLRSLLLNLSEGVVASAADESSDTPARERAEQTARELEHIQNKFNQLASEHEKLQQNYQKVADQVVEYEKKRVNEGPRSRAVNTIVKAVSDHAEELTESAAVDPQAEAPEPKAPEPKAKEEPKSRRIASPFHRKNAGEKKLLFDNLPRFDRERTEPVITGVVDLDELDDMMEMQRASEREAATEDSGTVEPERSADVGEELPEAEWDVQHSSGDGVAQPLTLIPGLSEDVVSRFEVLGLATNLDLLRKCAPRGGVNSLSMSMGLESSALRRWLSAADLLRLESMQADSVQPLIDAGIDSVQDLASSSSEELEAQLREQGEDLASNEQISKWIKEARGIADVAFV